VWRRVGIGLGSVLIGVWASQIGYNAFRPTDDIQARRQLDLAAFAATPNLVRTTMVADSFSPATLDFRTVAFTLSEERLDEVKGKIVVWTGTAEYVEPDAGYVTDRSDSSFYNTLPVTQKDSTAFVLRVGEYGNQLASGFAYVTVQGDPARLDIHNGDLLTVAGPIAGQSIFHEILISGVDVFKAGRWLGAED
jgi:hypothetical protein